MVGDATCCIETSLLISEFLGCSSAEIHRSEMGACVIAVGQRSNPRKRALLLKNKSSFEIPHVISDSGFDNSLVSRPPLKNGRESTRNKPQLPAALWSTSPSS